MKYFKLKYFLRDWELGQRHGLETLSVMDDEGRMINVAPEFEGIFDNVTRRSALTSIKV